MMFPLNPAIRRGLETVPDLKSFSEPITGEPVLPGFTHLPDDLL